METYWLKIANFSCPLSFGAPALDVRSKFYDEETRVLGPAYCLIVAPRILSQIPARDGRKETDGHRDLAGTALCIASYADALQKC